MKSLDPFISYDEETAIKSVSSNFIRGWLSDDVVDLDAFLHVLCEKSGVICPIRSSVAQTIPTCNLDLSSYEYSKLLIPIYVNSHWVSIKIDKNKKILDIYDPLRKDCLADFLSLIENLKTIVKINFNVRCSFHCLQLDNSSCGLFVCYYAHQIVHNYDVNMPFDNVKFRKFIYQTLRGSINIRCF